MGQGNMVKIVMSKLMSHNKVKRIKVLILHIGNIDNFRIELYVPFPNHPGRECVQNAVLLADINLRNFLHPQILRKFHTLLINFREISRSDLNRIR